MLEEIIDAVRRGGGIILSAQSPENYTSVKEGKANYVTRYDVAVQNFLKEELLKIAPQAQFIGEEGDADQAEPDRPAFVVDPIDGTTNFIKGYRKSCIAVAYTENGAVQIGVVLNPFTGELFYAKAGSGAFLNGRRLAASQRPLSEELAAFGTSPYYPELVDVPMIPRNICRVRRWISGAAVRPRWICAIRQPAGSACISSTDFPRGITQPAH